MTYHLSLLTVSRTSSYAAMQSPDTRSCLTYVPYISTHTNSVDEGQQAALIMTLNPTDLTFRNGSGSLPRTEISGVKSARIINHAYYTLSWDWYLKEYSFDPDERFTFMQFHGGDISNIMLEVNSPFQFRLRATQTMVQHKKYLIIFDYSSWDGGLSILLSPYLVSNNSFLYLCQSVN